MSLLFQTVQEVRLEISVLFQTRGGGGCERTGRTMRDSTCGEVHEEEVS